MNIMLEDVVALLEELLHNKERAALQPDDNPHMQYSKLGQVAGVKAAIFKLENTYGRTQ